MGRLTVSCCNAQMIRIVQTLVETQIPKCELLQVARQSHVVQSFGSSHTTAMARTISSITASSNFSVRSRSICSRRINSFSCRCSEPSAHCSSHNCPNTGNLIKQFRKSDDHKITRQCHILEALIGVAPNVTFCRPVEPSI